MELIMKKVIYFTRCGMVLLISIVTLSFTGCEATSEGNNAKIMDAQTQEFDTSNASTVSTEATGVESSNTSVTNTETTGSNTASTEEIITEHTEGENVQYTFKKADPEKLPMPRHNIRNVYDYNAVDHSRFIGQALTLFGEADYVTHNYEDICSWAVSATDQDGNVLYLEVYHGPSGPAIGGADGEESEKAADELAELIMSAEPTDFHWQSSYDDVEVTIIMGVENGKPYYDTEFSEEFEALMESYYNQSQ